MGYYNPSQMEFAQKFDTYIQQSGRTKVWLTRKLGYKDRSIINRWLDGYSQIPFEALIKFCQLCELDEAQSIELTKLAGYEQEVKFIEEMLQRNTPMADPDIFTAFTEKSGALGWHIRVREFQSLVKERTKDFIGRQYIFQAIDDLLVNPQFPSGYIVIQGEPGIGKTALMAQLVKDEEYVHHFNIAVQNIRSGRDFLANICAQLIVRYELPYHLLPSEASKDGGFLSQLLIEVLEKAADEPVVVLVDALDEAEDYNLSPNVNRLFLPPTLPEGVFFIITSREQADFRLSVDRREDIYLRDNDPQNLDDIRHYIQDFLQIHSSQMANRLADWGLTSEKFVGVMTEKSQGNFMYLVYVLRDIREGRLTVANLDDIRRLPQGLRGYYQRHWRLMQAQDKTRFETYYEPVVCYLATAREPIKIEQLAEWTDLPDRRIKEVINDWQEFLNMEETKDGELMYHIYHTSFQDFLKEEVGLTRYHDGIAQNALNKIPGFDA